ncbi:unnamed protein product [Peniophora sp. CBMAI 1063]|nr:unnamed protein product [Peniophora sp. CBMAI 1063]
MSNVDNPTSTPRKIVNKSPDLWLDDRDVILFTVHETKSDSGVVERVHTLYGVRKSTLGLGSEMFESTFRGPQDAFLVASETYEGLPMMRMFDDHEDVDAFFHAIYIPGYQRARYEEHKDREIGLVRVPPSYPGILRLARKFIAPPGVAEAVTSAFDEVWPSDMHKFMRRESVLARRAQDTLRSVENEDEELAAGEEVLDENGENPWDVTRFFSDPVSAYSEAEGLPPLLNALPTIAYDIAHAKWAEDDIPPPGIPFRRIHLFRTKLPPQTIQSLNSGIAAYRADCVDKFSFESFVLYGWPVRRCERTPHGGATSPAELACFAPLQAFWERRVRSTLDDSAPIDLGNFPVRCHEREVCASCAEAFVRHMQNARYAVWLKLPAYFDLTAYVNPWWGMGPGDANNGWARLPKPWKAEITSIWDPKRGEEMWAELERAKDDKMA